DNVTDSYLSFRQQVDCGVDLPYPQNEHKAVQQIFGFDNYGPTIQNLGDVLTRQSRLLCFPNVMQHRVSPFRLADPSKPGVRKILALFLVDPHLRIISTANVPPQQHYWWSELVHEARVHEKMPPELVDKVLNDSGFPVSLDKAKEQREELMAERKDFVKKHNREFVNWKHFNMSSHLADQSNAPKNQPDPLDRPSPSTNPKKRKRDQDPVPSSALLQTPPSSKRHQASVPSDYPTDKESPAPAPPRSHDQSPLKPPQISPPGGISKGDSPNQDSSKDQVGTEDTKQAGQSAEIVYINPVEVWLSTGGWPKILFTQGSELEQELWPAESEAVMERPPTRPPTPVLHYAYFDGVLHPHPVPRPIPKVQSVRRRKSGTGLDESSEQETTESKTTKYQNPNYQTMLAAKGSYMDISPLDITESSKILCKKMLNTFQQAPENSLFRDDVFEQTCRDIQNRNEARIIQDIGRLIVPSPETLAKFGSPQLAHLIENVNETWSLGIPVEGPRPQPDFSVGFKPSAFTQDQLSRLGPWVGSPFDTSYFAATMKMYFPFLTSEVKCSGTLDLADRQNAHSMTLAVKGIVELFRLVGRETELHRELLAFAVSHDAEFVKIWGHYPVVDGGTVKIYRHRIRQFSFADMDGRDKWQTYQFTKNVYDIWMPKHLERICSVIDQLPAEINFAVHGSVHQISSSGLSQGVGALLSETSNDDSSSHQGGSQSVTAPQAETPETLATQPETTQTSSPANKAKRPHDAI
ncbi:MAG: hypothetical protein Q9169_007678, partial [Polycauliona sp. 2 TL-2023]